MLNVIVMQGNLVSDPSTRDAGSTTVCTFRIACNRRKPKGGGEAGADFIDVKAFGTLGETVQRNKVKGEQVLVRGRLAIDEVQRRDGDGKMYFTSIIADDVQFVGPRSENGGSSQESSGTAALDELGI